MADNISILDGGGASRVVATDDVGSVHNQRVKVRWGVDGAAVDVSATDPLPVRLTPTADGASTPYKLIAATGTNAAVIKASAGQIFGYHITSESAAYRYVKLYDKATTPTVGTDVPKETLGIPPGSGAVVSIPMGVDMGTAGIAIATLSDKADAGTAGVLAADNLVINIWYA